MSKPLPGQLTLGGVAPLLVHWTPTWGASKCGKTDGRRASVRSKVTCTDCLREPVRHYAPPGRTGSTCGGPGGEIVHRHSKVTCPDCIALLAPKVKDPAS